MNFEAPIRVAELNAKNDQLLASMDARVRWLEAQADRLHEASQTLQKHAHEHAMAVTERVHEAHIKQTMPPPMPEGEMPPPDQAAAMPDEQAGA